MGQTQDSWTLTIIESFDPDQNIKRSLISQHNSEKDIIDRIMYSLAMVPFIIGFTLNYKGEKYNGNINFIWDTIGRYNLTRTQILSIIYLVNTNIKPNGDYSYIIN